MNDSRQSNSYFEQEVLIQLGDIKAICATNSAENKAVSDRVEMVEQKFKTQDNRHWIKTIVMSAAILIGHPILRKIGWDV